MDEVVDEAARDVRRVADRLRGAPPARLSAHRDHVRAVLQHLADAAAALGTPTTGATDGHGHGAGRPGARVVPELADHALGDQVEVLGAELVSAARAVLAAGDGPSAATAATLRGAAEALRDLRRAL